MSSFVNDYVTVLTTPDNKTVTLPSGTLFNGSVVNFSTEEFRRIDWTFGMGYNDDTAKARIVLMEILTSNESILKDSKPPFVEVSKLGDSSVNFACSVWVKQSDYWDVFFKVIEQGYNSFKTNEISIPYPQMDVHIHNN
jgi:small conductance mechanosensitive channel